MNNNQSNDKSQNELDLGLNQAEPVTPRKPVQSGEGLFGKAKGLFGRKEQPETQFHVRKEPTFGESSASEAQPLQQPIFEPTFKTTAEQVEQKVEADAETVMEKVESKAEEIKENVAETVEQAKEKLSAGANAASSALKRPEKWKVLQILPEKHRRLFIAILALVVLLIVFFALKPNSDTVESFEQQGNEIPVQFQSLDQSQPVETTVLDGTQAPQENAPAAEQPAQPETTAPAEPGKMEYMGDAQKDAVNASQASQTTTSAPAVAKEVVPQAALAAPVRSEPAKSVENVVEPRHEAVKREVVKHEVTKPVVQERKVVEKAAAKPVSAKVEKADTAHKVPVQEAKVAAKNERKVQIVEAKPAGSAGATKATTATTASGASKTLTVPQGVSLMQVFRDNNLNISDVNAMTKATGAGNALSSFKPGDKVQVSLNGQGRVNELRLSNGAKFVRQADGSYQYKK